MGKIKWYKRYPTNALEGMMELTLEERGAYNTVLDLIYSHDNELLDDERLIAGWMRVDVRVWRRLKDRLIGCGKLYVSGGLIHNLRADGEADAALHRVASAADAGRQSGIIRGHKSGANNSEVNDLSRTTVATDRERPFERTRTRPRIEGSNSFLNGGGHKKNGHATTIDDPASRLLIFQAKLAATFPARGTEIVAAAANPNDPQHKTCLALAQEAARRLGKGWPHNWPA